MSYRNLTSPPHIQQIMAVLLKGKAKHHKIMRHEISQEHISALDAHAKQVFGDDDCEVMSVEGCNSCCADGISASLRHTTCGTFCDKVCGAEPCH